MIRRRRWGRKRGEGEDVKGPRQASGRGGLRGWVERRPLSLNALARVLRGAQSVPQGKACKGIALIVAVDSESRGSRRSRWRRKGRDKQPMPLGEHVLVVVGGKALLGIQFSCSWKVPDFGTKSQNTG